MIAQYSIIGEDLRWNLTASLKPIVSIQTGAAPRNVCILLVLAQSHLIYT